VFTTLREVKERTYCPHKYCLKGIGQRVPGVASLYLSTRWGTNYRSAVIGSSSAAVVAVAVSLPETGEANKTTSF